MNVEEKVLNVIGPLKPFLAANGRDIVVQEATEDRIAVSLSGFCGGCGCSAEYVDGLKDMLMANFPGAVVEIETK